MICTRLFRSVAAFCFVAVFTAPASAQPTTRVSVTTAGVEGDGGSAGAKMSADGRWVAFSSIAENLVEDDENGEIDPLLGEDIFLRDRLRRRTILISVNDAGEQGNDASYSPAVSEVGRYVAFVSLADNLVEVDANGVADIFVRDVNQGITTRVNFPVQAPEANDESWSPAISANGRYVAFVSAASNLVPGDNNNSNDVFVHDRVTRITKLISRSTQGVLGNGDSDAPMFSGNGRFIVFESDASNLVTGDTNNATDVFFHDLRTGETSRLSTAAGGVQGNDDSFEPTISHNGRYVGFASIASNLVTGDTNNSSDVFIVDRKTGTLSRISVSSTGEQGNDHSSQPVISATGRRVAFSSVATNLIGDDTNAVSDVFVHTRRSGKTIRVSLTNEGAQSDDASHSPTISASSIIVTFMSDATNLVAEDENAVADAFVRLVP